MTGKHAGNPVYKTHKRVGRGSATTLDGFFPPAKTPPREAEPEPPRETWRASCCWPRSWSPRTWRRPGAPSTRSIARSAVTLTSAKAACAVRGRCWTTVAAAGCAPLVREKLATARSQAWMAWSVAPGWGVSFTVRRMILVTSLVSAKVKSDPFLLPAQGTLRAFSQRERWGAFSQNAKRENAGGLGTRSHTDAVRERERKITLQIATEPSVQESPERNTAFHSLCLGDFFFKFPLKTVLPPFLENFRNLTGNLLWMV